MTQRRKKNSACVEILFLDYAYYYYFSFFFVLYSGTKD